MAVAIAEVVVQVRKSPESSEIAERLRAVWHRTGLTAREVAIRMGLSSPESFRQYLKGNIRNWPAAVPKLALGMDMDAEALANEIGVQFDPQAAALMVRLRTLSSERQDRATDIYDRLVTLPPHLQDRWFDAADLAMVWVVEQDRKQS